MAIEWKGDASCGRLMEKVSPILPFYYSGRFVNVKMRRNIYRSGSRQKFALLSLIYYRGTIFKESAFRTATSIIDIAAVFTATTHFSARSLV